MTRKHIVVSLLVSLLIAGSVQAGESPKDVIVLLDTSSSMFKHFQTMGSAVIQPLLSSRVSNGDTVHVVSFAEKTRLELSRRVEGPADIETVATHLLLLYPLEPWSDVIQALDWTGQYLKQLPSNRPKTLVVISDGEHLAPPGSPNAALDREQAKARIEQSALELKGNGWDFIYLKTPWTSSAPLDSSTDTPPSSSITTDAGGKTPVLPRQETSNGESSVDPQEGRPSYISDGYENGKTSTGSSASTDSSAEADSRISTEEFQPEPGNTDIADESPSSVEENEKASEGPDGGFDTSDSVAQALPADLYTVDGTGTGQEDLALPLNELSISWPQDLGEVRYRFTLPVRVSNAGSDELLFECRELLVDEKNILEKPLLARVAGKSEKKLKFKVALGDAFENGPQTLSLLARFAGETNIHPANAVITLNLVGKPSKGSGRLASTLLLVAGIILALILAVLILVSFRRSLSSPAKAVYRSSGASRRSEALPADRRAPEEARSGRYGEPADSAVGRETAGARAQERSAGAAASMAAGAGSTPGARNLPVNEDFPVRRHEERIMLSLYVYDQNTAIGRRNVHLLKAGGKLSLGGGNSDFLIFLVKFPERIAKVHFDGEQCHLSIHKSEFFPNAESSVIEDCIGKRIDIVSSKGYKVWFRIDRYEDPLEKLNRFLRSIEHQSTGLPLR